MQYEALGHTPCVVVAQHGLRRRPHMPWELAEEASHNFGHRHTCPPRRPWPRHSRLDILELRVRSTHRHRHTTRVENDTSPASRVVEWRPHLRATMVRSATLTRVSAIPRRMGGRAWCVYKSNGRRGCVAIGMDSTRRGSSACVGRVECDVRQATYAATLATRKSGRKTMMCTILALFHSRAVPTTRSC